jgi:putative membrane protein
LKVFANEPQQTVLTIVINSATANVEGTNIGSSAGNLTRKIAREPRLRAASSHYAARRTIWIARNLANRGRHPAIRGEWMQHNASDTMSHCSIQHPEETPIANPTTPNPMTPNPIDPRVLLAAERTYLAWLRTGLALMGFGFVVARFGLFLREVQTIQKLPVQPHSGASLWLGTGLVGMGVVAEIAATVRHLKLVQQLKSGAPFDGRASRTAVITAILLAAIGLALAAYLLLVR